MFTFHPKSTASLFLASLTLLVTSTPLPASAADENVELRWLTHKNFNASIAHDAWYVSRGSWLAARVTELRRAVATGHVFPSAVFTRTPPSPDQDAVIPLFIFISRECWHTPSPLPVNCRFVEFYSPYCSHCEKFEPTWKSLAKSRDDPPRLSLAKVDCIADAGESFLLSSFARPPARARKRARKDANLLYGFCGKIDIVLTFSLAEFV
jgi:protein-disulfide isomerase